MAKKDAEKTDVKEKGEKVVDKTVEPAKIDIKAVAASDGRIDAKFDDVKSGAVEAPKLGDGPKSAKHNELPTDVARPAKTAEPKVELPPSDAPKLGDGPKSATHNELPTEPARPRATTETMAAVTPVGEPPNVPAAKTVEDPTNMPGPKNIPSGNPTDAALPPGHVPPGDSRSLRRENEFALVYRQGSSVITRWGTVGQRGQWRVVEYPTTASASNSYAKECSRFVAEGFSDYRD